MAVVRRRDVKLMMWVIISVSVFAALGYWEEVAFSRRARSQDAVLLILGVGDGGVDVMADIRNEMSSRVSAVLGSREWDNETRFWVKALGGEWMGLRNVGEGAGDGALVIRVRSESGRIIRGRS